MIAQLLDYGQVRLGKGIVLERSEVDLGALARSAREELASDREIALYIRGNVIGTWDGDRLSQLVTNLVTNACRHGTSDVPVTIMIDGSARDIVRLEVANQGEIPPEVMPILFAPFSQAGGHREKRPGTRGLGLGLYLTRQIPRTRMAAR